MLSGNGPVDLGLNLEAALDGVKVIDYLDNRIVHWQGVNAQAIVDGNNDLANRSEAKVEVVQKIREYIFGSILV